MNKVFYLCAALVFLSAWNYQDDHKKGFVDVAGIDSLTKPGDNFFRFVNGRWYDTAKIADDQSGVGSYSFMNIPQKQLLQNILDSVSNTMNENLRVEQKVGDFYASGMDMATVNQRGYQPIKPVLARIDAISDVPRKQIRSSGIKNRKPLDYYLSVSQTTTKTAVSTLLAGSRWHWFAWGGLLF